jgi:hypothetical protein
MFDIYEDVNMKNNGDLLEYCEKMINIVINSESLHYIHV